MTEQPRLPAAQRLGFAFAVPDHGGDPQPPVPSSATTAPRFPVASTGGTTAPEPGSGEEAEAPEGEGGNGSEGEQHVVIIGPDGQPIGAVPAALLNGGDSDDGEGGGERAITDLVEQPAKVMRIGSMIRQLLEEVKSSPLDEASRNRLKQIHRSSIEELEQGLAPELVEELNRLTLPFSDDVTPTEGELRIAQAQLVGWLEGLFHGIQTAIYAQQMAARAQFEQMRKALPAGIVPGQHGQPGQPGQGGQQDSADDRPHDGGMYL